MNMNNENELLLETLITSRDMIYSLKGTVASLREELEAARDENEGLLMTVDSLEHQLASLTEKVMVAESKEEETETTLVDVLSEKLSYYYKDVKEIDEKKLTAEDAERLYNILMYTYKTLKKSGVKL